MEALRSVIRRFKKVNNFEKNEKSTLFYFRKPENSDGAVSSTILVFGVPFVLGEAARQHQRPMQ